MNKIKHKLSDLVEVKNGSTPSTARQDYYDGDIVWITPKDLSNNKSKYVYTSERKITKSGFDSCSTSILPIGSVLLSSRAPIGLLAICAVETCTNQGFKNLVIKKDKIYNEYLFYWLKTKVKYIDSLGTGTTFKEVSKGVIENLEIEIPANIKDQQKIASVLTALDSKIELNNRINAELEAMAKTLYDYWFVQFEFSAEALAKPGNKSIAGKPYKTSGGKMIWNEDLKREIPEGWRVNSLSSLAKIISRGISPKYMEAGGVCVLNQKCIRDKTISFNFSRRHDNDSRNATTRKIKLYDVLVNSTGVGTLGRVAMVKRLPEEFITVDSHITIVRPNPDLINELYFGFTITQKQKEIEGFSLGSTGQVELSRSQLESIYVIVPPLNLQSEFSNIYSPLIEKIAVCEKENQKLTELRDWLLPMLMNGQVRVK